MGSRGDQLHLKKLKLAMALRGKNKHYRVAEIDRRHFNETAALCGLGKDMEHIIADVLASLPDVLHQVGGSLPKGFPEAVFAAVASGLRRAHKQLG